MPVTFCWAAKASFLILASSSFFYLSFSRLILSVIFLLSFFWLIEIYLVTYPSSFLKHSDVNWSSSNSKIGLAPFFETHSYTIGTTPFFYSRVNFPMLILSFVFSSVVICLCYGSGWILIGPVGITCSPFC